MGSHNMIKAAYQVVKGAVVAGCASDATRWMIREMSMLSIGFLDEYCTAVDLRSLVAGQSYSSQKNDGGVISRPANKAHFAPDATALNRLGDKWAAENLVNAERHDALLPHAVYSRARSRSVTPCTGSVSMSSIDGASGARRRSARRSARRL